MDHFLVIDLEKGRHKGSRNKKQKYVARFQDSKGNWIYIYPHDKEVDKDGKLLPGVKVSSILRRFFDVETETDKKNRLALGIKDKKEATEWVKNPYTKNYVAVSKPALTEVTGGVKLADAIVKPGHTQHAVVANFEVADEHKEEYKEGFPASVSQFFTSLDELERIKQLQSKVPTKGISTPPAHVLIPAKDEAGKIIHDINGQVVIVGQHGLDEAALQKLAATPPETEAGTGIHVIHAIEESNLDKPVGGKTKIVKPAGYTLNVEEVMKQPGLLAKYGDDPAKVQAEARDRPFTLWMTAGMMGGTNLSPKAKQQVLKEWNRDIYKIAAGEVSRFKDTPGYNTDTKEANEHYIKQNLSDYIQDVNLQILTDWLPNYQANSANPNDRFDKWLASKIDNYVRDRIKRDLKEKGGEEVLEGEESGMGRPDVGSGSKVMSPDDWQEYNKYAVAGRSRVKHVLANLPGHFKRIVSARLWLDSPESEKEERAEISKRGIKNTEDKNAYDPDEVSQEMPGGPAPKTFERSFADILAKNPKDWPFKVDLSTPKGKAASIKAAQRLYEKAIANLAVKLTAKPIVAEAMKTGKIEGTGVVFDHHTGKYFTKENYAAKRYLELEAKRVAASRSVPAQVSVYTKEGQKPLPHPDMKTIARHGEVSYARLYPSVAYFENHKDLAHKLGLDWGPIKIPSWINTKPRLGTQLAENEIFEPHHKYGLPQVEHKNLFISATPEQSRRLNAMKAAHTFMRVLSHKTIAELNNLHIATTHGLRGIETSLGIESPHSLATSLHIYGEAIASPDEGSRTAAAKNLMDHAAKLYQAEKFAGLEGVAERIRDLVSTPIKSATDGANRSKAILRLGIDEAASKLKSKIQQWSDQVKMLDHELASRSKMAKAISFVGPNLFIKLFHDLDFAIGMASV